MSSNFFIEVDYQQIFKFKQIVGGDVFQQHKMKDEGRIITVLSDGLGSGIKANVLATLTTSMAVKFISGFKDIKKTAKVIMQTLPVCKERKISYSTFTIIDIESSGRTRIIEYDNPPFILIRDDRIVPVNSGIIKLPSGKTKENVLNYSDFEAALGDRIVFFTDGVSQSGIGTKKFPLGWGQFNIEDFVLKQVKNNPTISARELSKSIVLKAHFNDGYKSKDDITCGVIYLRRPRKLMVLTGPPTSPDKDKEFAEIFAGFAGKKIISGGTTANIVARELNRIVSIDMNDCNNDVPPRSYMEGVELITEGTITIGKVLEVLEGNNPEAYVKENAVSELINYLLDSDIIHFVVGTKVNDAHQDPNFPFELGIRRNLIKNIVNLLEEKYLKHVELQYI
jgi:Serine phosphatase RsbU, regulator of sigma subunit